mgnify:CR=1 FL=1|jgi:hypothetical protein|tara:strand:- start:51 stop:299 length:249 start_codon:yes stop_codon:yes gene_type:complete
MTIITKGMGAIIKGIFKPKPSSVISSVKPGKNLKKKRDIQDTVVKTKDKLLESLDAQSKINVRTNVPLKNTNKAIAKIVDKK